MLSTTEAFPVYFLGGVGVLFLVFAAYEIISYRQEDNDDERGRNNENSGKVVVDLGTDYVIHLGRLLNGIEYNGYESLYSISDRIWGMSENNATTELSGLTVYFSNFTTYGLIQPEYRDFVQFLLQCIRSTRNPHLRTLVLADKLHDMGVIRVIRQFLMAAAQSETLRHVRLAEFEQPFPVQALVEFLRANRNVAILELKSLTLTSHSNENPPLPDLARNEDYASSQHSSISTLDELILDRVTTTNQEATRLFADVIGCQKISTLCLGDNSELDTHMLARLMVESPIKRLKVRKYCKVGAFDTALKAGNATLKDLSVEFVKYALKKERERKVYALMAAIPQMLALQILRLKFFTKITNYSGKMMRFCRVVNACATLTTVELNIEFGGPLSDDMRHFSSFVTAIESLEAKLGVLRVNLRTSIQLATEEKKRFFKALNACTNLTEIQVSDSRGNFSPDEMRLLQGGRTGRNRALSQFVANPPDYPAQGSTCVDAPTPRLSHRTTATGSELAVTLFQGKQGGWSQDGLVESFKSIYFACISTPLFFTMRCGTRG